MADHGFFEELICAGLDGELTAEQQAALDAHLAECEQCRAFRDALEAVEGVSTPPLGFAPEHDIMSSSRASDTAWYTSCFCLAASSARDWPILLQGRGASPSPFAFSPR